jgi:hypothetical protein
MMLSTSSLWRIWPVLAFAASGVAQGNWGLNSSDTWDRLVTNPTRDKDINVTNKSSDAAGVRVRVYDDANNNGKWDEGEAVTTSIIIEKGESATVGIPAGKECDVELVNTGSSASGSWSHV